MLPNRILTVLGLVRTDFGWTPKGPESAVFVQKACWLTMVLKMSHFSECHKSSQTSEPGMLSNSLKRLLHAWKWISQTTACRIVSGDFGWIRKGPKLADFDWNAPAIPRNPMPQRVTCGQADMLLLGGQLFSRAVPRSQWKSWRGGVWRTAQEWIWISASRTGAAIRFWLDGDFASWNYPATFLYPQGIGRVAQESFKTANCSPLAVEKIVPCRSALLSSVRCLEHY